MLCFYSFFICQRFELYQKLPLTSMNLHIPILSRHSNARFTPGFLWYVRSKVKRCHLQNDVNRAWRCLGGRSTRRHNTPHVLLHNKRGSVFLLVVIPRFLLSVQISQKYVKCLCWFNWCWLWSYVNWSWLEMKRLVNTSLAGHKGGINYLQVKNKLVFNRLEQLFFTSLWRWENIKQSPRVTNIPSFVAYSSSINPFIKSTWNAEKGSWRK